MNRTSCSCTSASLASDVALFRLTAADKRTVITHIILRYQTYIYMKLLPEHTAKHVTKSIVTEVTEFHASKLFVTATVHFLHKTVQY